MNMERNILTEKERRFITDQLANCNDLMSEDEMIAWFIECGINKYVSASIVHLEIDNFRKKSFYEMNWNNYKF